MPQDEVTSKRKTPIYRWTEERVASMIREWLDGKTFVEISVSRGYKPASSMATHEVTKFCKKYTGMQPNEIRKQKRAIAKWALEQYVQRVK